MINLGDEGRFRPEADSKNGELRQETIIRRNKAALMRTARRDCAGPLGHAPWTWISVGTFVIRISAVKNFVAPVSEQRFKRGD
ncbi:hypothetical protein L7Q78_14040 [Achromobacter xylosoxidans]|nr:hypothetical protein [Achromobacter xylosoxidans]